MLSGPLEALAILVRCRLLAELGDRTQLMVLAFAPRYRALPVIRRAVTCWTASLLLAAALVPAVVAHDGGEALIHVPADHVMPGEPFALIAADFDPHSSVEISVLDGDHVERLTTVVAEDDGHFEVDLVLPTDHPHGNFQLVGFSEFGVRAATWVLVGPRAEGPPPGGAPGGADGLPLDPSVLVLGVLVGGAGLGLVYLFLRPSARRASKSRPEARRR